MQIHTIIFVFYIQMYIVHYFYIFTSFKSKKGWFCKKKNKWLLKQLLIISLIVERFWSCVSNEALLLLQSIIGFHGRPCRWMVDCLQRDCLRKKPVSRSCSAHIRQLDPCACGHSILNPGCSLMISPVHGYIPLTYGLQGYSLHLTMWLPWQPV